MSITVKTVLIIAVALVLALSITVKANASEIPEEEPEDEPGEEVIITGNTETVIYPDEYINVDIQKPTPTGLVEKLENLLGDYNPYIYKKSGERKMIIDGDLVTVNISEIEYGLNWSWIFTVAIFTLCIYLLIKCVSGVLRCKL